VRVGRDVDGPDPEGAVKAICRPSGDQPAACRTSRRRGGARRAPSARTVQIVQQLGS
jgi:hypothetical protein